MSCLRKVYVGTVTFVQIRYVVEDRAFCQPSQNSALKKPLALTRRISDAIHPNLAINNPPSPPLSLYALDFFPHPPTP
jgi:hypothetical protein